VITGFMGGAEYSTYALALESKFSLNDAWQFTAKAGKVPGQPAGTTDRYKAVFLNPNYRLGMILFGYQLQNLDSTSKEAFYSPVTNANYLHLGSQYSSGKWQFRGSWLLASANETAAAREITLISGTAPRRPIHLVLRNPTLTAGSWIWALRSSGTTTWSLKPMQDCSLLAAFTSSLRRQPPIS